MKTKNKFLALILASNMVLQSVAPALVYASEEYNTDYENITNVDNTDNTEETPTIVNYDSTAEDYRENEDETEVPDKKTFSGVLKVSNTNTLEETKYEFNHLTAEQVHDYFYDIIYNKENALFESGYGGFTVEKDGEYGYFKDINEDSLWDNATYVVRVTDYINPYNVGYEETNPLKKSFYGAEYKEYDDFDLSSETEYIYDDTLENGKTVIDQDRVYGYKLYKADLIYTNGKEKAKIENKTLIKEVESRHKIVRIGTKIDDTTYDKDGFNVNINKNADTVYVNISAVPDYDKRADKVIIKSNPFYVRNVRIPYDGLSNEINGTEEGDDYASHVQIIDLVDKNVDRSFTIPFSVSLKTDVMYNEQPTSIYAELYSADGELLSRSNFADVYAYFFHTHHRTSIRKRMGWEEGENKVINYFSRSDSDFVNGGITDKDDTKIIKPSPVEVIVSQHLKDNINIDKDKVEYGKYSYDITLLDNDYTENTDDRFVKKVEQRVYLPVYKEYKGKDFEYDEDLLGCDDIQDENEKFYCEYVPEEYIKNNEVHEEPNEGYKRAEFVPELSEGWKLSDDKKYVYKIIDFDKGKYNNIFDKENVSFITDEDGNKQIKNFPHFLFPNAKVNERINVNSEVIRTFYYDGGESDDSVRKSHDITSFVITSDKTEGDYILKDIRNPHYDNPNDDNGTAYFYDYYQEGYTKERNGEFKWTMTARNEIGSDFIRKVIFDDNNLDKRMKFSGFSYDDERGEVLYEVYNNNNEVIKKGKLVKGEKVDIEEELQNDVKNVVLTAENVNIDKNDKPFTVNIYTKLKNPQEDFGNDTNFINEGEFTLFFKDIFSDNEKKDTDNNDKELSDDKRMEDVHVDKTQPADEGNEAPILDETKTKILGIKPRDKVLNESMHTELESKPFKAIDDLFKITTSSREYANGYKSSLFEKSVRLSNNTVYFKGNTRNDREDYILLTDNVNNKEYKFTNIDNTYYTEYFDASDLPNFTIQTVNKEGVPYKSSERTNDFTSAFEDLKARLEDNDTSINKVKIRFKVTLNNNKGVLQPTDTQGYGFKLNFTPEFKNIKLPPYENRIFEVLVRNKNTGEIYKSKLKKGESTVIKDLPINFVDGQPYNLYEWKIGNIYDENSDDFYPYIVPYRNGNMWTPFSSVLTGIFDVDNTVGDAIFHFDMNDYDEPLIARFVRRSLEIERAPDDFVKADTVVSLINSKGEKVASQNIGKMSFAYAYDDTFTSYVDGKYVTYNCFVDKYERCIRFKSDIKKELSDDFKKLPYDDYKIEFKQVTDDGYEFDNPLTYDIKKPYADGANTDKIKRYMDFSDIQFSPRNDYHTLNFRAYEEYPKKENQTLDFDYNGEDISLKVGEEYVLKDITYTPGSYYKTEPSSLSFKYKNVDSVKYDMYPVYPETDEKDLYTYQSFKLDKFFEDKMIESGFVADDSNKNDEYKYNVVISHEDDGIYVKIVNGLSKHEKAFNDFVSQPKESFVDELFDNKVVDLPTFIENILKGKDSDNVLMKDLEYETGIRITTDDDIYYGDEYDDDDHYIYYPSFDYEMIYHLPEFIRGKNLKFVALLPKGTEYKGHYSYIEDNSVNSKTEVVKNYKNTGRYAVIITADEFYEIHYRNGLKDILSVYFKPNTYTDKPLVTDLYMYFDGIENYDKYFSSNDRYIDSDGLIKEGKIILHTSDQINIKRRPGIYGSTLVKKNEDESWNKVVNDTYGKDKVYQFKLSEENYSPEDIDNFEMINVFPYDDDNYLISKDTKRGSNINPDVQKVSVNSDKVDYEFLSISKKDFEKYNNDLNYEKLKEDYTWSKDIPTYNKDNVLLMRMYTKEGEVINSGETVSATVDFKIPADFESGTNLSLINSFVRRDSTTNGRWLESDSVELNIDTSNYDFVKTFEGVSSDLSFYDNYELRVSSENNTGQKTYVVFKDSKGNILEEGYTDDNGLFMTKEKYNKKDIYTFEVFDHENGKLLKELNTDKNDLNIPDEISFKVTFEDGFEDTITLTKDNDYKLDDYYINKKITNIEEIGQDNAQFKYEVEGELVKMINEYKDDNDSYKIVYNLIPNTGITSFK